MSQPKVLLPNFLSRVESIEKKNIKFSQPTSDLREEHIFSKHLFWYKMGPTPGAIKYQGGKGAPQGIWWDGNSRARPSENGF